MKQETCSPSHADTNSPSNRVWPFSATQDKVQALEEIAHAIKAKGCLTKQDAIFLILRELTEVKK